MLVRYILLILISFLIANHFVAMSYSARSFVWVLRSLSLCIAGIIGYIVYSIDKRLGFPVAWAIIFSLEVYAGGYLIYKELNK